MWQAAARFGVGVAKAIRWVQRWRESGERRARKQGHPIRSKQGHPIRFKCDTELGT